MTKKSINEVVKSWMKKAEHDVKAAQVLLAEKEALADMACYHSCQAAEKLFKAFLVSKQISFSKSHDLFYLHKLCQKEEMGFNLIKVEVNVLRDYAFETRYPEEEFDCSLKDAKLAVVASEKVLKFVKDLITDL